MLKEEARKRQLATLKQNQNDNEIVTEQEIQTVPQLIAERGEAVEVAAKQICTNKEYIKQAAKLNEVFFIVRH